MHRFLPSIDALIPDFRNLDALDVGAQASLNMYDFEGAREIYRNFLSWMFRTFDADESAFRSDLIARLKLRPDSRVLITGCGIGDDVSAVCSQLDSRGEVFALDLAPEMVVATHECLREMECVNGPQISLCVADACHLPFPDGYFDASFHFGGINLFDDVKLAIAEMTRVTNEGGRIVFGDEGVAPWLTHTEYGRMVVANNHLWQAKAPIEFLPFSAINPRLTWVLGNCFYVIEFEKKHGGPFIDPDVPHVGRRGGSMRTRYFGQLEGVNADLKAKVMRAAAEEKISVTEWLERAIGNTLKPRN